MHLSVVSVTVLLHAVQSYIFVALARAVQRTSWRHLQRQFNNRVVGNLAHSLVVGSLAAYSILVHWHDTKILHDSLVPFITAEISLCFWLTELLTTLVTSPRTILTDKGAIAHHTIGILCLPVVLWWRGITLELAIIRLLSQLSVPFLVLRLVLLDLGMSETFLYLATFSSMIVVFFLFRIATLPWYWTRVITATPDMTSVFITLFFVSPILVDLLNCYWLFRMLYTYCKYYPDRYNPLRIFRTI